MIKKLPFWLKILYGSGNWDISSIGIMRSIFYAPYLTDVVGIELRLASLGAGWRLLVCIPLWIKFCDPLVRAKLGETGRIADLRNAGLYDLRYIDDACGGAVSFPYPRADSGLR